MFASLLRSRPQFSTGVKRAIVRACVHLPEYLRGWHAFARRPPSQLRLFSGRSAGQVASQKGRGYSGVLGFAPAAFIRPPSQLFCPSCIGRRIGCISGVRSRGGSGGLARGRFAVLGRPVGVVLALAGTGAAWCAAGRGFRGLRSSVRVSLDWINNLFLREGQCEIWRAFGSDWSAGRSTFVSHRGAGFHW